MSGIRTEKGFTLIELLIVMPMLLILLGGLTLTLTNLVHGNAQTQEETTLQTEARAAINTLTTDIREAYVGDGTDPILSASATSITLESPDHSPTTTTGGVVSSFHLRKLTYSLVAGTLQRQLTTSTNTFPAGPPWTWPGTSGAFTPVVGSVTNTDVFTYFTAAGVQTSPPTALGFPVSDTTGVRAVGIKLTLSTLGSQPKVFTMTDIVALREMDS